VLKQQRVLTNQLDQIGFFRECAGERFIESRQGKTMVAGDRDEVMVRDLVCSFHQIRPYNSILAT
jgi:hypothetical protein